MKLILRRMLNPRILFLFFAFISTLGSFLLSPLGRLNLNAFRTFAVLSVSDQTDDRRIIDALEAGGFTGVIAESTQWVDIAGFDSMERIPLDQYRQRIDQVDPRDDGYADQLRAFFEIDGDRRYFIPMTVSRTATANRVEAALGNIGYQLAIPTHLKMEDFILFIIATGIALVLAGRPLTIMPALPALLVLAGCGTGGLTAAACVFLVILISRESVETIIGRMPLEAGTNKPREILSFSRFDDSTWLSLTLIGIGYFVAVLGGVPPITAIVSGIAALSSSAAFPVFRAVSDHRRGHPRFAPLRIIATSRALFLDMLRIGPVFMAAILLSLVANSGFARTVWIRGGAVLKNFGTVDLDDYKSHIDFQHGFALTRMDGDLRSAYRRFTLDADGLLKLEALDEPSEVWLEIPPVERYLLPSATVLEARNNLAAKWIAGLIAVVMTMSSAVSFLLKRRRQINWFCLSKKAVA